MYWAKSIPLRKFGHSRKICCTKCSSSFTEETTHAPQFSNRSNGPLAKYISCLSFSGFRPEVHNEVHFMSFIFAFWAKTPLSRSMTYTKCTSFPRNPPFQQNEGHEMLYITLAKCISCPSFPGRRPNKRNEVHFVSFIFAFWTKTPLSRSMTYTKCTSFPHFPPFHQNEGHKMPFIPIAKCISCPSFPGFCPAYRNEVHFV